MKEELLKSVAQPMQVFYAPFRLVIFNIFLSIFLIFIFLVLGLGVYLPFLILFFIFLHFVAVLIGKKEPHIDNILMSRKNIRAKTENLIVENGNKFSV